MPGSSKTSPVLMVSLPVWGDDTPTDEVAEIQEEGTGTATQIMGPAGTTVSPTLLPWHISPDIVARRLSRRFTGWATHHIW